MITPDDEGGYVVTDKEVAEELANPSKKHTLQIGHFTL